MTPAILEMTVDSTLESVSALAQAVRSAADKGGCAEQELFALELAASEAGSNVVRHAYGGMPGGKIRVRLIIDAAEIVLCVLDDGLPVPIDPRHPKPPPEDPLDPAHLAEGGRGIFIIHSVMDEVRFETEGRSNLLRMSKRRCATPEKSAEGRNTE